MWRKTAYAFYWRLEELMIPELRSSQYWYRDVLRQHVIEGSVWLDLGCGHEILPAWVWGAVETESALVQPARMIVGVDADFPSVQKHGSICNLVVADLEHLPFRDGVFTLATANMVVEHLKHPATALAEVRRVLQPQGHFIFHTPNCRSYLIFLASLVPQRLKPWLINFFETRKKEDVFPTVYAMNTPEEIEKTARAECFHIRELKMVNTSAETVMLGPVVILELGLIWILQHKRFARLRTNIIAVLQAA